MPFGGRKAQLSVRYARKKKEEGEREREEEGGNNRRWKGQQRSNGAKQWGYSGHARETNVNISGSGSYYFYLFE